MNKNILDQYREKYGYYNEDTLKIATLENPGWLIQIILDADIKSFSRSFAILALAEGARDEYFEFIKSNVTSPCPFMREASFMGLFEYHCYNSLKYPDLKDFFEFCLFS